MDPARSEMISVFAPAASRARRGSANSDCSNPSVATIATRLPARLPAMRPPMEKLPMARQPMRAARAFGLEFGGGKRVRASDVGADAEVTLHDVLRLVQFRRRALVHDVAVVEDVAAVRERECGNDVLLDDDDRAALLRESAA